MCGPGASATPSPCSAASRTPTGWQDCWPTRWPAMPASPCRRAAPSGPPTRQRRARSPPRRAEAATMGGAHGDRIPRPAILGAAGLVVVTILAAAGARLTGMGTVEVPPSAAVETRQLVFEDAADGSVVVRAPAGGEVLHVVQPGTNGFLRGVLRGLAR